jgi:dTDP-4-dehydrorhamnose reductase
MPNPMMLITGANGMLGSKLVSYFSSSHSVAAVDIETSIFAQTLDTYVVDLTSELNTEQLIQAVNPDIIIHCAGLVNVDRCEKDPELARRTNVAATRFLAQACSKKTLFIYISSDQVYGDTPNQSETSSSLSQLNHYALTKYQGEEVVRELCPRHIIARTNIFGWNMQMERESFAEWIINNGKSREPIFLFHDYIFSPIYVGLFAKILNQLITAGHIGTFNLSARDYCSKYEFGMKLINGLGMDTQFISPKSIKDHKFSAKRTPDMRMNIEKLSSLGIIPPSFSESIDAFMDDSPRAINTKVSE